MGLLLIREAAHQSKSPASDFEIWRSGVAVCVLAKCLCAVCVLVVPQRAEPCSRVPAGLLGVGRGPRGSGLPALAAAWLQSQAAGASGEQRLAFNNETTTSQCQSCISGQKMPLKPLVDRHSLGGRLAFHHCARLLALILCISLSL